MLFIIAIMMIIIMTNDTDNLEDIMIMVLKMMMIMTLMMMMVMSMMMIIVHL